MHHVEQNNRIEVRDEARDFTLKDQDGGIRFIWLT